MKEEAMSDARRFLTTMAILGSIQRDRLAAKTLIADATAKYTTLVGRLKVSELTGLTEAVLAEWTKRGGESFAANALDHVLGEVVASRESQP